MDAAPDVTPFQAHLQTSNAAVWEYSQDMRSMFLALQEGSLSDVPQLFSCRGAPSARWCACPWALLPCSACWGAPSAAAACCFVPGSVCSESVGNRCKHNQQSCCAEGGRKSRAGVSNGRLEGPLLCFSCKKKHSSRFLWIKDPWWR